VDRERLLHPEEVEVTEALHRPHRLGVGPPLVGVDHERVLADRLTDLGEAVDVLLEVRLAALDLAGEVAGALPLLDLLDDLVRAEVEVDAAAVQRDVLADTAEDVGQRLVALLADDVPERDVDRGQGERRDASRSAVADVAPGVVPDRARVDRLSEEERAHLLEHGEDRAAADTGGVGEPGADDPGVGADVGGDDLDVGDVVDLVAPVPLGEPDAGELVVDLVDLHGRDVSFSCVGDGGRQPLTAPAARPATRRFWTSRNPMITGTTARTPPAVRRSQRIWYSPMNSWRPTGRVRVASEAVKVRAERNSSQVRMKT